MVSGDFEMRRDLDLIRSMMLALEANAQLSGRYTVTVYASQLFPDLSENEKNACVSPYAHYRRGLA